MQHGHYRLRKFGNLATYENPLAMNKGQTQTPNPCLGAPLSSKVAKAEDIHEASRHVPSKLEKLSRRIEGVVSWHV